MFMRAESYIWKLPLLQQITNTQIDSLENPFLREVQIKNDLNETTFKTFAQSAVAVYPYLFMFSLETALFCVFRVSYRNIVSLFGNYQR